MTRKFWVFGWALFFVCVSIAVAKAQQEVRVDSIVAVDNWRAGAPLLAKGVRYSPAGNQVQREPG